MPFVNATIDIRALAEITRGLQAAVEAAEDMEDVLDEIGQYMVRSTENRILRQKKSPEGDPWAALAQSTIDHKGHSSILFETGELSKSISYTVNGVELHVTSNAEYASYMQDGFKHKGKKKVPARPFIGFSAENNRRIAKMLRDYVREAYDRG